MGYTTEFTGQINLSRKLTINEAKELIDIWEDEELAEEKTGITGYMQWVPTQGLDGIVWDGGEKFYDYVPYMKWLCDWLKNVGIVANGQLHWRAEDRTDTGRILVVDNFVHHLPDSCARIGHCEPLTRAKLEAIALERFTRGEK